MLREFALEAADVGERWSDALGHVLFERDPPSFNTKAVELGRLVIEGRAEISII